MGIFIRISLEVGEFDPPLSESLVSACPVDIFEVQNERLVARSEREDECTLCELCLNLAPAGALTIHKLYKNESLVSRGEIKDGAATKSPSGM
jgi:NAD-dependent dihydropyrimidine dehydrogenase PreA subunit